MLKAVGPLLKAAYPNVLIFGAEYMLENEGGDNRQFFLNHAIAADPEALKNLDIFAVHQYTGSTPPSVSTLEKYWSNSKTDYIDNAGRPLWMTETSQFFEDWEKSTNSGALDLGLAIHAATFFWTCISVGLGGKGVNLVVLVSTT